jgi:hypothetical protein
MFARRRPVLRAAAVGAGAYVAGKRRAERSGTGPQQAVPQQAVPQQAVPQQAEPRPAEPQPAEPPSMADQLSRLSDLHAQGALTDAEFASAKSQLLGR